VHEYEPGHALDAVLDPENVFVFETATGRLVASPGTIAFSSEAPSGSREENASKNKST